MDVPSTAAGTVTEVLVQKGGKIGKGGVIARIEGAQLPRPQPRRAGAAAAAAAPLRRQRGTGCRRRAAAPRRSARPRLRQAVEAAQARRAARSRDPAAGAGRGSRRLHRRVPRRRSRPQGHAGRALADARRRLPQRRLHSVQGAAARGQGHRRSRRDERVTASTSARRRSTCAKLLEWKNKRRQASWSAACRCSRSSARSKWSRASASSPSPHVMEVTGSDGKAQKIRFEQCIIAAGSEAIKLPVHPGRSARHRFHRRAGAGRRAEAAAGHRRRHHRPRDGHGVRRARREAVGGRAHARSSCRAPIPIW